MSRRITAALTAAALTLVLATAGASGGPNSPGQQPPKNLTPPSVSGTARVPNTLSSGTGTWQGKGLKFAYQWLRCDSTGASCAAISGSTGSTKTLTTADVNQTLRVIVTATNRNGSAAATSAQTEVVAAPASAPPPPPPPPPPDVPPSSTALPTTSGTAQEGQTLNASTGSWSGSTPMTYGYQWQRCDSAGGACAAISGATSATYALSAADVGRRMRVSITASNSVGSATASSDATAVVASTSSLSLSTCGGYYAPSGTPLCASGAKFVRTFESPEGLPPQYTGSNCCGPWWLLQMDEPLSSGASIVPDPAGSSNHVVKLTVQPGTAKYFTEAALIMHEDDTLGQIGRNSWYVWDQYVAPSWTGAPNTEFNWTHEFLDAPGSPGKCSGQLNYNVSLGINTIGGTPRWRLQVGPAGVQTTSNCAGTTGDIDIDGPSLVKGRWQHFVENINWSATSSGRVRIWIDGTLAFDHSGPNIYQHPNGSTGNEQSYWMDYRQNTATGTDIIYYDNIGVGSTAASAGVAP